MKIKDGDRFYVMDVNNKWMDSDSWFYKLSTDGIHLIITKDGSARKLEMENYRFYYCPNYYREISLEELPFYL